MTVRGVKEKHVPELDDDFAQSASEFDTIDELKADEAKSPAVPDLSKVNLAAGKSANFEIVPQTKKLGGNGPIMAFALSTLQSLLVGAIMLTVHASIGWGIALLLGVVADGVSGAESLAVGLEHQNLDVVVAVGIQQRGVDFFGQLLVLGVCLLRPVQRDLRDRPVFLIDDPLASLVEIHLFVPFLYEVITPISAPMS